MRVKSTVVSTVAVLAAVAVIVGGCANAGGGGGGSSSSSPDYSVSTAVLNAEASAADFSDENLTFDGGKDQAFIAAFLGMASAGQFTEEYVGAQLHDDANWQPGSGTVSISPDPDQLDTAEEIAVSGSVSGETLTLNGREDLPDSETVNFSGTVTADATANLEATQDPSSNGPEKVTMAGEATADLDLSKTEPVTYHGSYDMPDLLGGAIHMAANLDGAGNPDYEAGGSLYDLLVEYAVSARLSAAVSVQDAGIDTNSDTTVDAGELYSGHFLVSFSYDDSVLLDITNSLLGDGSALADYIESKVSTDFTLTIDVYDDGGSSVENRYTYSAADLEAIFGQ